MSLAATPQRRAEILDDWQALLDYLRANEDVEIWHSGYEISFSPDDGRAGVARIAQRIGERPERRLSGAYRVVKRFRHVAYVAYARPQREQERAAAPEGRRVA